MNQAAVMPELLRQPLAVLANRLPWAQIEANLAPLLARRVRDGRVIAQDDNNKLHAPEVECIGKGKARKPYEFGVKVSIANAPKQVIVDLGYRGVDADNPSIEIIHRGKFKSLSRQQRRWLKRRQAVEPAIGHCKHDNAMDRCWLKGQTGDAVLCAAGYNIRWLLRAMVRLGLKGLFAPVLALLVWLEFALATALCPGKAVRSTTFRILG